MEYVAKINRKFLMSLELEVVTPLLIGSGYEDGITDVLVLQDKNGKPFIPGTSLAGALKNRVEEIYGTPLADKLFGSIEEREYDIGNQSMINISDVYLNNAEIIIRDGVAIDSFTGVGKDGAKYDYQAVDRGASGNLVIEVTVRDFNEKNIHALPITYRHDQFKDKSDAVGDIIATIADILYTELKVGALTAKGFGKIATKKEIKLYAYDFTKNDNKTAWLQYIKSGKIFVKPIYTSNKLNISAHASSTFAAELDMDLVSSLIIRDIGEELSVEGANNVSVQMTSHGEYVIPGTTVKGVLRNRAVRILTAIKGNKSIVDNFIQKLMGFANDKEAKKSRLSVDEIYIPKELLNEVKHARNRINRFTGGTVDSALFTELPVMQKKDVVAPVKLMVTVTDCKPEEAGLMLLLIKDLWLSNLAFGGGKSIGRGLLKGKAMKLSYDNNVYSITDNGKFLINGDAKKLQSYVKMLGE